MMLDNRSKTLLKNIIFIGVGTIFSKMIVFLLTPLYSNWLSTSDYGLFDLLVTYVTLCAPICTLELEQAIYRFCMDKKDCSKYYFNLTTRYVFFSYVLVSFIATFILYFFSYKEFIPFFLFYLFGLVLYTLTSEFVRGNEFLVEYSSLNVGVAVLLLIGSFAFIKHFDNKTKGLIFTYGVAYLTIAVIIILRHKLFNRKFHEDEDIKINDMMAFSLPLIPNNIAWWITNVSDRTIIRAINGSSLNGIYAVSCKIPSILSIFFMIFNLSFQQIAIQSYNDEDQSQYFNSLFIRMIKLLFSGSAFIVAITPIYYTLFINHEYHSGIVCVPILLVGAVFLGLAQFLGDILLAKKETKIIGISTIIASIINLVLNFYFIYRFDIVGASITTMFSYIIMFSVRFYKMKNTFNIFGIISCIIKYLFLYILIILIALNITKLCFMILFSILVSIIFIYINREIILSIFRKRVHNESINS